MTEVRLARRAVKDLDSLPKKATLRVTAAIEKVAADPDHAGLYVKALVGRRPWRRLRVGNCRVLFRFADRQKILLVARVIDRKRLKEAVESLPD